MAEMGQKHYKNKAGGDAPVCFSKQHSVLASAVQKAQNAIMELLQDAFYRHPKYSFSGKRC
jgi:hypothetical protein